MCKADPAPKAQEQAELRKHLDLVQKNKIDLAALRKSIPPQCFQKSLGWSLCFLCFDFANVLLSLALHVQWMQLGLGPVAQAAGSCFFWLWGGFFMWGLFVVGHDCGHQTFSPDKVVNDFFGLVTHGFISVPFYPWALSHYRHHRNHNHYRNDYSHAWSKPGKGMFTGWLKPVRAVMPIIGWQLYLLGAPDGLHWLPLPFGRLFGSKGKDATGLRHALEAVLSTAVVAGYWLLFERVFGGWANVFYFYVPEVLVFGWWLVCVTYLQHHVDKKASKGLGLDGEGWVTKVYDGSDERKGTWNYAYAAFDTVDRTYGFGIDWLHHRISDCHVVHHLFFTQIPHYHLREATDAIVKYMDQHHPGLYKHVPTRNFATEIFRMFYTHSFDADLVSTKPIAEGGPYDPAFDKKAE